MDGIKSTPWRISLVLPGPVIDDQIEDTEDTIEISHIDMDEETLVDRFDVSNGKWPHEFPLSIN